MGYEHVNATTYRSEDEVGAHSALWMGSVKHGEPGLPAPQARRQQRSRSVAAEGRADADSLSRE
jgi:hypothetical protein